MMDWVKGFDPVGQLNPSPSNPQSSEVLGRIYGPESQGSYNAMNQGTIKKC